MWKIFVSIASACFMRRFIRLGRGVNLALIGSSIGVFFSVLHTEGYVRAIVLIVAQVFVKSRG